MAPYRTDFGDRVSDNGTGWIKRPYTTGVQDENQLGQPGSSPVLVLSSGGMAAEHRKGVTTERLLVLFYYNDILSLVGVGGMQFGTSSSMPTNVRLTALSKTDRKPVTSTKSSFPT
ncbi:hypothetical protein CSKR_111625 [Clonorchis sinensis]|uniref:Uncharacterized protein n=1 Tax=Clonorchis sinensis TaxID=79923 RepID=A0A419Q2V2_CLOSI|nr:hypothetical protein CSKR_111625 [Clonorchis sinensis]